MAQSQVESFVFYENKQTDIYFPIRNSQRVKYTSFHVSQSYVAFGSSSGGLYLFQKCLNNSYNYLFTILNSDNSGPITCLSFASNDQNYIAMATSRGNLAVVQIEPEKQLIYKPSWNTIYQSNTFTNYSINILKWDQYYDNRLYLSDESGQIFVLHNVKSMTNLMVVPLPSLLLKISAKIFQLEICADLLLLSTQNRFCLYNLCDASLTQIGKRPRSDGQYGVCFFPKLIHQNHIYNCIFASRPKSRLWEVDSKGNVQFTHQFKELLINQNPVEMINAKEICFSSEWTSNEKCETTATFAKLCVMNITDLDTFIVTYSNTPNTCIYVINPIKSLIVSYCVLNATLIQDMYCIENDIYLIYNISSDKRLRFSKISLLTLDQCLNILNQNNEFTEAASFVINHMSYFAEETKSKHRIKTNEILENIWLNLNLNDKQTFKEIESLLNRNNNCCGSQAYNESELSSNTDNSSDASAESDFYNRMNAFNTEYCFEIDSQLTESGIDVVDIGFNELKKLKNSVFSKLNSVGFKPNLEPFPSDNEELSKYSITSLENQNNLDINKSQECIETEVKNDPKVILESFENELILSHYIDKCKCVCGSPLPGSHLIQSELQEKIRQLVYNNNECGHSVIDLIEICHKNAIWPLYMHLILKCEEYKKYIRYSLMLNDIQLLFRDKLQEYLYLKENFNELLMQFAQQRDCGSDQIVRCLECDIALTDTINSIKWENIIHLSIKSIGIEDTLILLKNLIHKNPDFSTQFYLIILRMRMISVYQSPVTREKLNKLMSHINSVRKVKSEIDCSPIASTSSSSLSRNQTKYSGFKINLSIENCAKCNTSLMTKNKSQKIVAFYCKHIYHKSCISSMSQNYCNLCKTL